VIPVLVLLFLVLPGALTAQGGGGGAPLQRLDPDRPEAWAMFRVSALTLLTGMGGGAAGAPGARASRGVVYGLELGWLPYLDAEARQIGFHGTKEEDTNKTPVLARLRLGWQGEGWGAELGVVPPVPMRGALPLLANLGVSLRRELGPGTTAALRLHGQLGEVRGDITCPAWVAERGEDPVGNPFRCQEASRDRVRPWHLAVEGTWARHFGGIQAHLAPSWILHRADFRVDASYAGVRDRSRLSGSTGTPALAAGGTVAAVHRVPVTVEWFYAPLWVQRQPHLSREREGVWNLRLLVGLLPPS